MSHRCHRCEADGATLECPGCKQVYYCDINCQTADNDSHHRICLFIQETLEILNNKEKWTPSKIDITASYIGNGFIKVKLDKFKGVITLFEMAYKFRNENNNNNHEENNKFKIIQFKTTKINRRSDEFFIRIPQSINNYEINIKLRARMFQDQDTRHDIKWSPYTIIQPLAIPFDNPVYQWQIGEKAQFMSQDAELYSTGTIVNILDHDIAEIEEYRGRTRNKDENIPKYKIKFKDLKFTRRYQGNMVDLLDWDNIYNNLLLSDLGPECQKLFVNLSMVIKDYLFKEKMIMAAWTDLEHDFGYFSRYLSFQVIDFLYEDNHRYSEKSIYCGLCPERDHYRAVMNRRVGWNMELETLYEIEKSEKIDTSSGWILRSMKNLEMGTMCDICLVEFHHFDYLYICDTRKYNQHAICLSCMNRNLLGNKRLFNVLNELYDIHNLSQDCVKEIVYFVVGWIH